MTDVIKEIQQAVPDAAPVLNQITPVSNVTQSFNVAVDPNQAIDIKGTAELNARAQGLAEDNIQKMDQTLNAIEELEQRIVDPGQNPLEGPSAIESVAQNFTQTLSNMGGALAMAFTGGGSLATFNQACQALAPMTFQYGKGAIKEGARSLDEGSCSGYGANTGWAAHTQQYGENTPKARPITVGSGPVGNKSDIKAAQGAIARSGGAIDMGDCEITEQNLEGIQKIKMNAEECRAISENNLQNAGVVAATLRLHEEKGAPRLDNNGQEPEPDLTAEEEYNQRLANFDTNEYTPQPAI